MDRKTILVIDDTPSNLILLNNLLCQHYRVKVAKGAIKGLQLALSGDAPELILLDVLMPELDGFEVAEILQMNRKTRHIPIIFLTTLHASGDVERGLSAGAVDFICKPVSSRELTQKIAYHFAKIGQRDDVLSEV